MVVLNLQQKKIGPVEVLYVTSLTRKKQKIFFQRAYQHLMIFLIEKLKDMENCIFIYYKNDLSEELDDILRIYKVIPQIRNTKSNHIRIDFECISKTIILVVDPKNDPEVCNYKRIQALCKVHNIEFKN